jgi:sulfate adenylyltransferase subunit 2
MTTIEKAAIERAPAARVASPHLKALESEAIHILREVAGQFDKPVILFSAGKDSVLVLHLARKAFYPAPLPF